MSAVFSGSKRDVSFHHFLFKTRVKLCRFSKTGWRRKEGNVQRKIYSASELKVMATDMPIAQRQTYQVDSRSKQELARF